MVNEMIKWRKWFRILHRDVGYIATGLTIIYSISGIAVNHVDQWNPNYVIEKSSLTTNPIPDELKKSDQLIPYILKKLDENGKFKNSFYSDSTTLNIFVEGNTIVAKLNTGEITQEKVKSRAVIRETNFLHLNAAKKIWTYVADLFAISLIFLAITGLFMIKGKNGIAGRGAWLTGLGVLIPIIFYLVYYYKIF
jgi:uncharacterized protein